MGHAVAAVFFEIRESGPDKGQICFRALRYRLDDPQAPYMSTRFPVETGEDKETPMETLVACVRHEIAQPGEEDRFRFRHWPMIEEGAVPSPFFSIAVAPDNPGDPPHWKMAYLLQYQGGQFRDGQKTEVGRRFPSGNKKPDEILYEVENLSVEELSERMEERRPPPFHRIILARAVERLMKEDRSVAVRYASLFDRWLAEGYFGSDEELVAKFFTRRPHNGGRRVSRR